MNLRQWCSSSFAVGLTMFLVGSVFYFLVPLVTPGIEPQYENSALYRDWAGWTSTYMLIHPFVYAPVFSVFFCSLRQETCLFPGIKGGCMYGACIFCVGSLPVFLLEFASFQVSSEVVVWWIAQNLCQYLAAGVVLGLVVDGVTIQMSTQLPASPAEVWRHLQQKQTFLEITRGWQTIENSETWPATLFLPATSFHMQIRLFVIGPVSSHYVRVTRVEPVIMEIETEESGLFVNSWNHQMRLESSFGNGCRYTDRIHLNAGLLTPFVWLFACLFYRSRQRRLKLIFTMLRATSGNA